MHRSFFRFASVVPLMFALGLPARADEVSDALQAALDAYSSGNLAKVSENMTMATQALGKQQSAMLAALLPAAPEGWTMTPTEGFNQSFGIMGGGAGIIPWPCPELMEPHAAANRPELGTLFGRISDDYAGFFPDCHQLSAGFVQRSLGARG